LRLVEKLPPQKPDNIKELFDRFWKSYPKPIGRKKAFEAFKRIKPRPDNALLEAILAAITKQRYWVVWQNGFIPLPAKWLDEERWMDEEPKKLPNRFLG
jgi:hypothetical protein